MSLIFSSQCEYALRAVLYLALRPPGELTSIREMVQKLDLPYHFLAKILQGLSRKGMLISSKGPRGGFALAMPAREITLLQIVEAIDGSSLMTTCALGFADCSGEHPCSVHDRWGSIRESIRSMLASRNVAQMARDMKKPEYRS
jgi:Rrf2 family protein